MAKRSTPLVRGHLENISRGALEKYQKIISDYVKGQKGVYALYRGARLTYVGLATDLRTRLQNHLVDRHAQTWDKFSIYLTEDDEHLRELEALVIRIAKPEDNRQKGQFAKSENLMPQFRRDIRTHQSREVEIIFGVTKKPDKESAARPDKGTPSTATPKGGTAKEKAPLVGRTMTDLLARGVTLEQFAAAMVKHFPDREYLRDDARLRARLHDHLSWLRRHGYTVSKNEAGVYKVDKQPKATGGKLGQAFKKEAKEGPVLARYHLGWRRLRADYNGRVYFARLRKDGTINVQGKIFSNLSKAGKAITKKGALNGWKFWQLRNQKGEWVYLSEVRKGTFR